VHYAEALLPDVLCPTLRPELGTFREQTALEWRKMPSRGSRRESSYLGFVKCPMSLPTRPTIALSHGQSRPLLTHELDSIPYHAYHGPGLYHLRAAASNPVLDLRQSIKPLDHNLWPDLERDNLL
jgi:hypothetical protein